jgi:hypothetical protein
MLSIPNIIKYLGLTAMFYFLIKAFSSNKLTDFQIICAVITIMIFVIFVARQNFSCTREGYQTYNMPRIYGNGNTDNDVRIYQGNDDFSYEDDDIRELKDAIGIDKIKYQQIKNREKEAMNRIKSQYKYDMVRTMTNPLNTIPLGASIYGYTYLPPENWFRAYERPPVCITDKKCPVCPIVDPTVTNLMEFDTNHDDTEK